MQRVGQRVTRSVIGYPLETEMFSLERSPETAADIAQPWLLASDNLERVTMNIFEVSDNKSIYVFFIVRVRSRAIKKDEGTEDSLK